MRMTSLLDDFIRSEAVDSEPQVRCYDLSSLANVIVEPWDEPMDVKIQRGEPLAEVDIDLSEFHDVVQGGGRLPEQRQD